MVKRLDAPACTVRIREYRFHLCHVRRPLRSALGVGPREEFVTSATHDSILWHSEHDDIRLGNQLGSDVVPVDELITRAGVVATKLQETRAAECATGLGEVPGRIRERAVVEGPGPTEVV